MLQQPFGSSFPHFSRHSNSAIARLSPYLPRRNLLGNEQWTASDVPKLSPLLK